MKIVYSCNQEQRRSGKEKKLSLDGQPVPPKKCWLKHDSSTLSRGYNIGKGTGVLLMNIVD